MGFRHDMGRKYRTAAMITAATLFSATLTQKATAQCPVYDIPRLEEIAADGKGGDWSDKGFRVNIMTDLQGGTLPEAQFDPKFCLAWNSQGILFLGLTNVADSNSVSGGPEVLSMNSWQMVISNGRGCDRRICVVIGLDGTPRQPRAKTVFVDPLRTRSGLPFASGQELRQLSIKTTARRSQEQYVVEALVPWSDLAVKPAEGGEIAANVIATHVDKASGKAFAASWYHSTYDCPIADRSALYRLRLSDKASEAVNLAALVRESGRDVVVSVVGAGPLAGRKVTMHCGQSVAEGQLQDHARADASVLVHPSGAAPTALLVEVEGGPSVTAFCEPAADSGRSFVANCVLGDADCQNWPMYRLADALRAIRGSCTRADAARGRLIASVEDVYLKEPRVLRTGDLEDLPRFLAELGANLDQAKTALWMRQVSKALDPQTPDIHGDNLLLLLASEAILTKEDFSAVAGQWLAANQGWRSYGLPELGNMFHAVSVLGPQARGTAALLFDQFDKKFLSDANRLRDTDLTTMLAFLDSAGGLLSSTQRELWAQGFQRTCLEGQDDISPQTLGCLLKMFSILQSPAGLKATLAKCTAWKSYSPRELVPCIQSLSSPKDANGAAWVILEHVEHSFLDKDRIGTLSASDLVSLCECCRPLLPPEGRRRWAALIKVVYATDANAPDPDRAAVFAKAMTNLGALGELSAPAKRRSNPKPRSSQMDAIRDCIDCLLLSGDKKLWAAPFSSMGPFLAGAGPQFGGSDHRAAWLAALRNAVAHQGPPALAALDRDDYMGLVDTLAALGDKAPGDSINGWLGGGQWPAADMDRLLGFLVRYAGDSDPARGLMWDRVLGHLTEHCLKDKAAARDISLKTWSAALSGVYPLPPSRDLWVQGLLASFAGDLKQFYELSPEDASLLAGCIDKLGDKELWELMKDAYAFRNQGDDRKKDSKKEPAFASNGEASLCLAMRQVLAAQPKDRQAVWNTDRTCLGGLVEVQSPRPVDILDRLIQSQELGAGPLRPEQVIDDISRRITDAHTVAALGERSAGIRLQRQLASAPEPVRLAYADALALKTKGDAAAAAAKYEALLNDATLSPIIIQALRRQLATVLLDGNSNPALFDAQIQALRSGSFGADEELWNLCCRALLKRFAAASPSKRAETWTRGLSALAAPSITLREKTLDDLRGMVTEVSKGDSNIGAAMLADLILLAPDLSSMRRLQSLRTAAFAGSKDWANARASAALEVILGAASLSTSSSADVVRCLDGYQDILQAGGRLQSESQGACLGLVLGQAGGPIRWGLDLQTVDAVLKAAAGEKLKTEGDIAGRPGAIVKLLAGKATDAARSAREALGGASSPREVAVAMQDIFIILATSGGSLADGDRFVRAQWRQQAAAAMPSGPAAGTADAVMSVLLDIENQLISADQPPSASGGDTYDRWPRQSRDAAAREMLGRWCSSYACGAQAAAKGGKTPAAKALWALSLTSQEDTSGLDAAIQGIVSFAGVNARVTLEQLAPLLPAVPQRRAVLIKTASVALAEGDSSACLSVLQQADGLLAIGAANNDFSEALLRVSAQMGLGRLAEAAELLAGMERWPIQDAQKAQALYVLACLRIKQDSKAQGLEALTRLVAKYPDAPTSAKAKELLNSLRGQADGK